MPTYRMNYQGTLSAAEQFQYGFCVTGSGSLSAAGSAAVDAFSAFIGATGVAALWPTTVVWTQVTTSQIPDGGGTVIQSRVDPITGTGSDTSAQLPNQIAVCVSLLTGFAGSRNRGRFFLPPPAVNEVTAGGRFPSGSRTTLAGGLTAMNTSLESDGFNFVLVSPSQNASIVVTSLRIGDVFDTQRSRRNALAETYTTVAV